MPLRVPPTEGVSPSGLPSGVESSAAATPQGCDPPAESNADGSGIACESPQQETPSCDNETQLSTTSDGGKLLLTAKVPFWLQSHWDFTFDQLLHAESQSHNKKVFLQIYTANGTCLQQIHITPWSNHWMIHTNRANTSFYAELGYYRNRRSFFVISRSNMVTSLPEELPENGHENSGRIPLQISQQERSTFFKLMGSDILNFCRLPSEEVIENIPIDFKPVADGNKDTSPRSLPRTGNGASHPVKGSSNGDTFLRARAKLTIHGSTHTDASLRIGGKAVDLDKTGHFSFQCNLDDGHIHVPIEATSADGQKLSTALLSFLRLTTSNGTAASTPQILP